MNLFLDNTGVQSYGLALHYRATGESDVKELLQLAELLVFAQRLVVGGYEIDRVRRATDAEGFRRQARRMAEVSVGSAAHRGADRGFAQSGVHGS